MKILIIEDEQPAAKRLAQLIKNSLPSAEIIEAIDSVESAVKWLRNFPAPDLIFLDIQLADGLSFDIFKQVEVKSPIIFTTAYDQYTLKAFKVNSVDYLLKPIDPQEFTEAIEKYNEFFQQEKGYDDTALKDLLASLQQKEYKERFLVKVGQQLSYLMTKEIAYFFSEDGLVQARHQSGKKHFVDYSLDQLDGVLDPKHFFRISRKLIVKIDAIAKINTWFNSRLKLDLAPKIDFDVIVSRERVGDFKRWLDK
ncbi:MAG: DNA-binding LytR/AlgR family response regulator [Paraglaciecola sp.]|jgi:DNA-binding LytR/AlgR family response regulator